MDNEYMRIYMINRYYKRRAEAIEQLGGKCLVCGTTDNLEFDHIDKETKTYDIGKLLGSASDHRLQIELSKCQLLCNKHHKEKGRISKDQGQVDHGQGLTGKKNCRCELCSPLKNEYNKQLKRRKRLALLAQRKELQITNL